MSADFERVMLKLLPHEELARISLQEGKMHLLLTEKLEQKDIESLRKSLDSTENALNKLDSAYGGAGIKISSIPGIGEYAQALAASLGRARNTIAKLDLEDPKWYQLIRKNFGQEADAEGVARAVTAIQTRANEFHGGVTAAINKVVKNLAPMVKDDPDAANKPISTIAGQGNIPSLDDLESGIMSALEKGGPQKGFLAKASSFFSGLFKKGDPVLDEITDGLPDELDLSGMKDFILAQSISSLQKAADAGGEPGGSTAPPPPDQSIVTDVATPDVAPDEEGQVDAEDAEGAEEPPPLPDEEADTEQENADDAIRSAASDAAGDVTSPMSAAMDAIQGWHDGLSKSSQSSLAAKDRLGGLKDNVKSSLENSADAVADQVRSAVSSWRDEHEETLIKSKRFAKRNFDSLEELIPQLASGMMKQVSESKHQLSHRVIRRTVYRYLDVKFSVNEKAKLINEDVAIARWQKLAGISSK